jgi:hypothetical protein
VNGDERRVIVSGSRHLTSATAVRRALEHAWGDGRGVLVLGAHPSLSDRYAARLWRQWGGHVQHGHTGSGWELFGRDHAGRARAGLPGADVSVRFTGANTGQVVEHDRVHTALTTARQTMHHHTAQNQAAADTESHRSVEHARADDGACDGDDQALGES